jgi:hypothetical protein
MMWHIYLLRLKIARILGGSFIAKRDKKYSIHLLYIALTHNTCLLHISEFVCYNQKLITISLVKFSVINHSKFVVTGLPSTEHITSWQSAFLANGTRGSLRDRPQIRWNVQTANSMHEYETWSVQKRLSAKYGSWERPRIYDEWIRLNERFMIHWEELWEDTINSLCMQNRSLLFVHSVFVFRLLHTTIFKKLI